MDATPRGSGECEIAFGSDRTTINEVVIGKWFHMEAMDTGKSSAFYDLHIGDVHLSVCVTKSGAKVKVTKLDGEIAE